MANIPIKAARSPTISEVNVITRFTLRGRSHPNQSTDKYEYTFLAHGAFDSIMSKDRSDPTLAYTVPLQLTDTIHRSVPEILSPENPANSAKGKIIIITGGGAGLGAVGIIIRSYACVESNAYSNL